MHNLILTEAQARTISTLGQAIPVLAAVVPRATDGGFWRDVYLAVPLEFAPRGYIRVTPGGADYLSGGYYHGNYPESWFRIPGGQIVMLARDTADRADLARRFTPIPRDRAIIPHPVWFGARTIIATAADYWRDDRGDMMAPDLLRRLAEADAARRADLRRSLYDPPLWDVSDEAFAPEWAPLVPPTRRVMGVDLGEAGAATLAIGEATLDGKRIILRSIRRVPEWPAAAEAGVVEEAVRRAMAEAVETFLARAFGLVRAFESATDALETARRALAAVRPSPLAPFPFRVYDPFYQKIGTIPPPEDLYYRPRLLAEQAFPAVYHPAAVLAYDYGAGIADGKAAGTRPPPPAPPLRFAALGVRIDRRGRPRYVLAGRRRG